MTQTPEFLFLPVGSAGDVHPMLGLARAMQGRGHRVSVMVNPYFEDATRSAEINCIPFSNAEAFVSVARRPEIWHPRKGLELVIKTLNELLPEACEALESYIKGREREIVLVGSSLAHAGRIAHLAEGIPLVIAHLAPSCFMSAEAMPKVFEGAWFELFRKLPIGIRRLLNRGAMKVADWQLLGAIAREAERRGLPRPRGIFDEWFHTADAELALFPEWFAPPQSDWPTHVTCCGFPLFDESKPDEALPETLKQFLDAGDSPLLVAPGSANFSAREFIVQAADAAEKLNLRLLVATPDPAQLPNPCPAWLHHERYVPFGLAMPHCRAIIHHGGIGTTAQALASGRPQLVMPLAFDQFDNAERVERLGTGVTVARRGRTAEKVRAGLERLLKDEHFEAQARGAARRLSEENPWQAALDVIESVDRQRAQA